MEMNLVCKLTGTERLTLYYDSVEELGQLACFKCLIFFLRAGVARSENWSKLGQNPLNIHVGTFARIKNLIWDQLQATKAEIIQS